MIIMTLDIMWTIELLLYVSNQMGNFVLKNARDVTWYLSKCIQFGGWEKGKLQETNHSDPELNHLKYKISGLNKEVNFASKEVSTS